MRRTIARRCQISLFLVLATLSGSFVSSFGLLNRAKTSFRKMSVDNPVTEVAEAVNGDTYLEGIGEVGSSSFEMDFLVSGEDAISPSAPPLTYQKFLTMQVLSPKNRSTETYLFLIAIVLTVTLLQTSINFTISSEQTCSSSHSIFG